MPVEVILPKVDMDMATGQISRWFIAEGATVALATDEAKYIVAQCFGVDGGNWMA